MYQYSIDCRKRYNEYYMILFWTNGNDIMIIILYNL